MVLGIDTFNTFQHNEYDAEYDDDEKYNIEQLTHWGISFIDNLMKLMLPR